MIRVSSMVPETCSEPGLFDPVTSTDGAYEYWPHGIDHPPESERGQFGNVALFGGNPFCDEAYSTLLTQPHLVSAFL
jgi:hypothetical protein